MGGSEGFTEEFVVYDILLNFDDPLQVAYSLTKVDETVLRFSPKIKFARKLYRSYLCGNYIKFFKLLKQAEPLQACILNRYIKKSMRNCIQNLDLISKSDDDKNQACKKMINFFNIDKTTYYHLLESSSNKLKPEHDELVNHLIYGLSISAIVNPDFDPNTFVHRPANTVFTKKYFEENGEGGTGKLKQLMSRLESERSNASIENN